MAATRGGRGDRGGKRAPLPRNVQVSKKIAWLLRHGAEKEGIELGEGGFANVQDVLNNRKLRSLKVTLDELRQIVTSNDKQRYTMIPASKVDTNKANGESFQQPPMPSDKPKDWLIRANQGHSLNVESEGLLQPLTEGDIPTSVVHGTTHFKWTLIITSGGLRPMGRNHVHFASSLPAGFKSIVDQAEDVVEAPVISGMRKSSTVLMFLDIRKAMDAGIQFWRSDNGVILSEGNEHGMVPLAFFKSVEDRMGEGVLLKDGNIVKDVPASWRGKTSGKE